ncbi:MAG: hypothetical protein IJZ87_08380 [Bacteroidales bacterium]|nr:hypothetical protein [Bacteroidales bacterium]
MSQYFGNVNKQFHVDGSSFEDGVDIGPLAIQPSHLTSHPRRRIYGNLETYS